MYYHHNETDLNKKGKKKFYASSVKRLIGDMKFDLLLGLEVEGEVHKC